MFPAFLEFLAREHPAFVHVPLGLVVTLPLAVAISYRAKEPRVWIRKAFFIAGVALVGSAVTLYTGLLWGRLINLIPNNGYLPVITSPNQVLHRFLLRHEIMALIGLGFGLICLCLLWKALGQARYRAGALIASLIWLGTWGMAGKLGGYMVFGSEELNQASIDKEAARKRDVEAETPVRALDYASLEPVRTVPFLTKAHGNRFGQTWVTGSGLDAYQAGKPLPLGSYVVLNTFETSKGRPTFEPGPIYMREPRPNGVQGFIFYWPRVPESRRAETGGDDSVYLRSPDPKLAACALCHTTNGPAVTPP